MGKNYFIADLHFGHKNSLAYDRRPFDTIEEADQALINNWNSAVGMDDDVYILGDASWYNSTKTLEILQSLNGNKHLIRGNHDGKILKNRDVQSAFCEIADYKELVDDYGHMVVLSHYPILFWNQQHRGSVLLYGHVHSTPEHDYFQKCLRDINNGSIRHDNDPEFRAYNVGAMFTGYTPRTIQEITNG